MKEINNLIKRINQNTSINIKNENYIVKTKTWYSIEEDKNTEYVKCELSNNIILVIIPEDNLIYIGKVITDMKYERIEEDKIKYNNLIFNKPGDGHQFVKSVEFGNKNDIEGNCIFEDYELGDNIISLGILTDKDNERADVYADILHLEDIQIRNT